MSSTNKTVTIELSQYIATDKPTYLVDYNGDMLKIDTAIADDREAITTAQGKANEADGKADANAEAIQTLNTELNDPSTGIAAKVNDLIGDVNTIESLIGNGTPTVSDQTVIGAINAIESAIAPAEDSATLGASYTAGSQFARGGVVYEALVNLTAGTAFTSLVLNTDYKVSDTIVEQIANVKNDIQSITDGYVLSGTLNVTYTADGTKTYAEDLTAAAAQFLAAIQALENDEEIIPREVNINNINLFAQGATTAKNDTTGFNYNFSHDDINVTNSKLTIQHLQLGQSGGNFKVAEISTTNTFTDMASETNTRNIIIRCYKYKKVK